MIPSREYRIHYEWWTEDIYCCEFCEPLWGERWTRTVDIKVAPEIVRKHEFECVYTMAVKACPAPKDATKLRVTRVEVLTPTGWQARRWPLPPRPIRLTDSLHAASPYAGVQAWPN